MKTETQKLEANIWKYYLYSSLRYMFFFIPVFVVYLNAHGLSITQVMILEAFYALIILLLEVPTGAIADIVGRKKTVAFGAIFASVATIGLAISTEFWQFLVAEAFYAAGAALASGANTALIYDTLDMLGRKKEFKKINGRASSITFILSAVTFIVGGYIYSINTIMPFILTAIPVFLASFIVFSMYEPKHKDSDVSFKKTWGLMREGIQFTLNHKKLRWIVLYYSFIGVFAVALFWLYQPFLMSVGVDVVYFGVIFAFMNIVAAISSFGAHRIEKLIGEKISFIILPLFFILSFLLLSFENLIFGLFALVLSQFAFGYGAPVLEDYVNRHIQSKNRATVLSVNSVFEESLVVIILPFIGFFVDVYSLSQAFLLSAVILFVINIILYVMRKI